MASVMSAILLTAAIIGLGYSCESQSQINSYSRGVQQTGAKREQKHKGVEVHQFMPQLQVPHTMVYLIHDVVRLMLRM